ncbi:MAG: cytochrome c biogenesis CcdA family protein [Acidimicrobiales bacterium]
MIDALLAQLDGSASAAPLLAFLVGVVLGLSPIALPSVPAVMALVSPGVVDADGTRRRFPLRRAAPLVAAFVTGMDGVVGALGLALVELAEVLTRAAVVLHVVAAVVLAIAGGRLLFRRSSLCRRVEALPLRPKEALVFGMVFAVGGCPACGPIALSIGAASAIVGGPLLGLATLAAFIAGRTVVLLAAAYAGDRLLPSPTSPAWRRLDLVVGVLFLASAAYYALRVGTGRVSTRLPGEPGGGLP